MKLRHTLPFAALALVAAPRLPAQTTMVFPHFVERAGRTESMPYTFDTTLYVHSYRIGGELELTLYHTNGMLLRARSGTVVCDPCRIQLTTSTVIRLEDWIVFAGGMPEDLVSGYIEIRLGNGATFDTLAIQGFIVNSHSSQFDLSITPIQGMMVMKP